MQFVEVNAFEVRCAVYELRRSNTALRFVLFPMLHVGDEAYYEEVARRAGTCSAVIVEGVDSPTVGYLTLTYRILGQLRRSGLIEQQDARVLRGFDGEVLHWDASKEEFRSSWRSMPLSVRLLVAALVPIIAVQSLFGSPRKKLAKELNVDDLPSREEILRSDEREALEKALVSDRDWSLCRKLTQYVDQHGSKPDRIGILYGAEHMRAIAGLLLHELGYRVQGAEWIRAWTIDQTPATSRNSG